MRKATTAVFAKTAAAAAGGVAASFVNGFLQPLNVIPAQYTPAVPLLAGAFLQMQKSPNLQAVGAGMAGAAGAALFGGILQGLEVGEAQLRTDNVKPVR